MAHNNDYTRIWAEPTDGLRIDEVASALGIGSQDIGQVCTSENINKWAKYKPIRFTKWDDLTEQERRGRQTDINNGIFFGVKLSSDSTSRYDLLHDVAFTYYPPTGGADSPYRLSDFNEYRRYASASIHGTIPDDIYFDLDDPIGLGCVYLPDAYSIDYAEVIGGESVLKASYACIIVSNAARTSHYICALKTYTVEGYQVLPMYRAGSGWTGTFYCDFSDTILASLRNTNVHITLFIVHNSGSPITQFPIDGEWHQYTTMQIYTSRGYAVPDGVNNVRLLKEKYITADPIGYMASNAGITINFRQTSLRYAAGVTSMVVTITDTKKMESVTKNLRMLIGSYEGDAYVAWSEFDIRPYPGGTWEIRTYCTFNYEDGKAKIGQTATYSGTFD